MVVQQDNTRHQPRSTSSSITPHRRLHRNTRTPNVSLLFEHTYLSTHISADNQYTPASKTADLTKTAPRSFAGQLLRSLKPSTNIDFLPLFHIKHRLRSGVLPSLSPSALPPSIQLSKDKAYRAVQTRALHSLAIIPRNLHGTPRSIQFRVDLNTLARSRSIHNRDKRSLRNVAQPRALRIYLRFSHATTRRAFKAHIRNSPAPPVLLYIITLRCFPSHFLLFLFLFGRSCGRQNSSSGSIYRNTSPLPARPDKPVRSPSSHASSLRYAATFRLRALFASCLRAFRQVRGSFCRRTAVRRPAPTLSAPSIPASGAGERIS